MVVHQNGDVLQKHNMENKVFDKIWFAKHQSKILWLANSWIGKYVFQFKKMGHYLDKNKKIAKITPYSVAQYNGLKLVDEEWQEEYTEQFFSRNEYARKLYFVLYPLWLAMHVWDFFVADYFTLAPQLSFGFSTLTVNPGSIGTHNPVDGEVDREGVAEVWATIRAGAGNNNLPSSASTYFVGLQEAAGTNNFKELERCVFCFDTSSLTSGATISATTMSLRGTAKDNTQIAEPSLNVYNSTPASTSALANGDYGQIGSTALCDTDIVYASFNTAGYNDFLFNATGLSNVSKTSISKFGARDPRYDVANVAPGWFNQLNSRSNLQGNYAANGSNKPKLVVTYTVASANGNFLAFM